MKKFVSLLILLTIFGSIGCVGFPLSPKAPADIQKPEYFRKSMVLKKDMNELNQVLFKYKWRCPALNSRQGFTIEKTDAKNGYTYLDGGSDTVLVAQYSEEPRKTTVKIWAVSKRLADFFSYVLEGNEACLDSVWDERLPD